MDIVIFTTFAGKISYIIGLASKEAEQAAV
jgi:hypothetical protein